MIHPDFRGRAALISGSTTGIGLAIAKEFALRGLQVIVSGLDLAEAEHAASDVPGATAIQLDVRDESSWTKALDTVEARHGPLGVLVSNAGVAGITLPLSETSSEAWQWTRSVNLDGAFLGLTLGARRLRANGRPGHIIATSSMSIFAPPRNMGTYVATKAAVVALCEALHQELAPFAIGVSVLLPGPVRTALVEANESRVPDGIKVGETPDAVVEMLKQGRDPEDVAKLAADALGTDRFWLFTHPELEHRIDTRTAEMKAALHSA